MSANAQYILLLVVAVALTFVVGQLLVRAGEPFLFEVFQDRKVTRSVNLLLSVLFYLITLGVLAIISDRRHRQPAGPAAAELRRAARHRAAGARPRVRHLDAGAHPRAGAAQGRRDQRARQEKLAERGVDPRPVTPQE